MFKFTALSHTHYHMATRPIL